VTWKVKGKILGKPKDGGPDHKRSDDVSGIACSMSPNFPWTCMVVDDESHGVQLVMLADGKLVAGTFIPLIQRFHDGKLIELDGEGVAYSDGYFYVLGSHGGPRRNDEKNAKTKIRADTSSHVFRLDIPPGAVTKLGELPEPEKIKIEASTRLRDVIEKDRQLAAALPKRLTEGGVTIEGVAVRDGRFYAGFRTPLIADDKAALLSVRVTSLFEGAEPDAHLFELDLGGRGIRDLAVFETGLLVLAGPVQDPPDDKIRHGDYRVYWRDARGTLKLLGELESFGDKIKPEAIQPIGHGGGKLSVLIMFDGATEGGPMLIEIDAP
jgi:hypothetical protein